jgi:hypothetical protein
VEYIGGPVRTYVAETFWVETTLMGKFGGKWEHVAEVTAELFHSVSSGALSVSMVE